VDGNPVGELRILRSFKGALDQITAVRSRLPHAENRAFAIGEDGHPPGVEDVERLGEYLSARLAHPGCGVVC